jgi:hypothetical protein
VQRGWWKTDEDVKRRCENRRGWTSAGKGGEKEEEEAPFDDFEYRAGRRMNKCREEA